MVNYLKKKGTDVSALLDDSEKIKELLPLILEAHSESFGVALAMLAGGLFIAFMGIRLFKPFLAISGLVVGGGTFFFLYQKASAFLPDQSSPDWFPWVFSASGGVLGSVLFIKAWNLGTYILCAYGGAMFAILIKGLIPDSYSVDQNLLMVIFAALGLLFARYIRDAAIICTSALSGAFLIFLGLDNLKTVGFRKFVKDAIANRGSNISAKSFQGEVG